MSADMGALAAEGVNSFKFFMAYKGAFQVDDLQLLRGLQRCKELGALPLVRRRRHAPPPPRALRPPRPAPPSPPFGVREKCRTGLNQECLFGANEETRMTTTRKLTKCV